MRTAAQAAWGKDDSKARAGSNSPIIFFLESISNLCRSSRSDLGLEHLPMCEQASMTRWGSWARVAAWVVQHHDQVAAAVAHKASGAAAANGPTKWASLLQQLLNKDILMKAATLAGGCQERLCWLHSHLFLQAGLLFCIN